MIKLGLVGAVKTHSYIFSSIFNGGEDKSWPDTAWKPDHIIHINEARVVKVWDRSKKEADQLAGICGIDKVVDTYEQVAEGVDAVIITDDGTLKHSQYCHVFLEKGIPTFIDKPLADTIEEAEEIIRYARNNNVLMMSSSALRYAKEMEGFRTETEKLGQIHTGMARGQQRGRLIIYGIHTIEMFHSIAGAGVKSVHSIGEEDKQVIKLCYKDGRVFVLMICAGFPWEMVLFGENGYAHVAIKDHEYYWHNLMKHFIQMIKSETLPVPLEETLEIMKICFSAEKSFDMGKKIDL